MTSPSKWKIKKARGASPRRAITHLQRAARTTAHFLATDCLETCYARGSRMKYRRLE
jgi:hypothetical protein